MSRRFSRLRHVAIAGTAFAAAVPFIGIAVFSALPLLWRCPPDQRSCDLPDMAAFGVAMVVAPLAGLVIAFKVFRRLSRD